MSIAGAKLAMVAALGEKRAAQVREVCHIGTAFKRCGALELRLAGEVLVNVNHALFGLYNYPDGTQIEQLRRMADGTVTDYRGRTPHLPWWRYEGRGAPNGVVFIEDLRRVRDADRALEAHVRRCLAPGFPPPPGSE